MQVHLIEDRVRARDEFTGRTSFECSAETADRAIQHAVDAVAQAGGGEVFVAGGSYRITSEVQLKSRVQLRGSGRGTLLRVVAEQGLVASGVDEVRVSDLSVVSMNGDRCSAKTGIVLEDCGDCDVRGVTVRGFGEYGIWLRRSSFLCRIYGCSLVGNGRANLHASDLLKGRGGHFVPNTIEGCMIYGGGCGIQTARAIVLNINACSVYQTEGHGFHLTDMSNSVLVSGCRTYQLGGSPVLVEDSHEINIAGNIFCWHRGNGIELRNVTWGSVNGNNVIDTGVRHDPPMIGIRLHEGVRGVQVVGNALFNWPEQQPLDTGISEDGTCYKNIIAYNTVSYFLNRDVVSEGRESLCRDNVSENMAYAPKQGNQSCYDGSIVPLHRLWRTMGPFQKDEFGFRYPDFSHEAVRRYVGGLDAPPAGPAQEQE